MQSRAQPTQVSVRGEARRTVAPDQASISCTVSATAASKQSAVDDARRGLAQVTGELAALGGDVFTVRTERAPLTWSAYSTQTHPEFDYDENTGHHGPTGRHHSSIGLLLTVRDFTLLAGIEAVIAGGAALDVQSVEWSVDHDNAAWASVRAAAIRAALLKGRDYAAALGGAVTGVEHVADAGLLTGDLPAPAAMRAFALSTDRGGAPDAASLDPVPQVLIATIEARLTAAIEPPEVS
ncbi:MAG TPA: SIMPL domain-containing protein [Jatrophihabitans sp.]|nr:SIMPL domain-containing protein [Jatrophihabitans sp.]